MNAESHTIVVDNLNDFVKLVLGKTRILLPATELLSIEPGSSVRQPQDVNNIHGYITTSDMDIFVYAFDEDLRILPIRDNQCQFCVCLGIDLGQIGILCDDASTITLNEIKQHELPACMQSKDSVISAVVENNNNLYCISKTSDFLQLIRGSDQD
jgi:hypothetical protein